MASELYEHFDNPTTACHGRARVRSTPLKVDIKQPSASSAVLRYVVNIAPALVHPKPMLIGSRHARWCALKQAPSSDMRLIFRTC